MANLIVVAALVCGAGPEPDGVKGYHEYSRELRDALRREAVAESPGPRAEAICELANLYGELAADPRLATSDTLTQMKNKLWRRLTAIKRDLERQIAREEKESPPAVIGRNYASPVETEQQVNEQQVNELSEASAARPAYSPEELASPAAEKEAAFGGGAMRGDWGRTLVALIERTIAPDKWDTVGGPFSIMYYAPLKVLVVRATGEVHNDVGGVLGGLRAAGP